MAKVSQNLAQSLDLNLQKVAREKLTSTYKGTPIKVSDDFSAENLQATWQWHDISKILKKKKMQSRIFHPAGLSFRIREIKDFSDKQ